ncbi:MAG: sigma-70 family RNA polymerase sigma factor [Bryobacteraceae bacterium]
MSSDTELMLRVREGDTECIKMLLDKHWDRLVAFIQRMVHNRAVAEELAQEAFLRVYLSRERYEPTAKFTTWLYRIATNRALNWIRDTRLENGQESLDAVPASGIRRQLRDPGTGLDDALEVKQRRGILQEQVREALDSLPARQKRAVIMHRWEEMEYARIARELGCTVPTVKSLLWRAYTTLRVRLQSVSVAS